MWLRLYPETIWDRKLRRHPPAYRWVWVAILCLASEANPRGRLVLGSGLPVSLIDLADAASVPEEDVLQAVLAFIDQGMIQYTEDGVVEVAAWSKRQFASDGGSTERARRTRERASEPCNSHAALQERCKVDDMQRSRNAPDTDTDSDSEQIKRVPVSPPAGGDAPPKIPPCPYEKLKAAWNEIMKPAGVPGIDDITANRRRWITREWAKQRPQLRSLEDFRRFFTFLAKDCSNAVGKSWFSFNWLFEDPENFTKALEGNYHNARGGGKA